MTQGGKPQPPNVASVCNEDELGDPVIEPLSLYEASGLHQLQRWPDTIVREALVTDDEVNPTSNFPTCFQKLARHILNIRWIVVEELSTRNPAVPDPWLWKNSVRFLPARLNVIMGGSGCGKSTLLDLFRGRLVKSAQVTGRVIISCSNSTAAAGNVVLDLPNIGGYPFTEGTPLNNLKRLRGYVPQEDIVFADLTVRENILYSAAMKMTKELTGHITKRGTLGVDVTEACIDLLDLSKVQHNRVGVYNARGISGGQRKRTSIGMELVGMPSILLMDEPTSGLDATGSLKIVKLCRMLTDLGITIISVLHQPRWACFSLFDHIVLLTKYGTVFSGSPSTSLLYFTRALTLRIDPSENPADVIMDVVTKDDKTARDMVKLWRSKGHRWTVACVRTYPALNQNMIHATVTFDEPTRRMMRCLLEHFAKLTVLSDHVMSSSEEGRVVGGNQLDKLQDLHRVHREAIVSIDSKPYVSLLLEDEEDHDHVRTPPIPPPTTTSIDLQPTTVTAQVLHMVLSALHVDMPSPESHRLLGFCLERKRRTTKAASVARTCTIDDVLDAFAHVCLNADLGKLYDNVITRQELLFDMAPKPITDTFDEGKHARAIVLAYRFGRRLMRRAGIPSTRGPAAGNKEHRRGYAWDCEFTNKILQACMTLKALRHTVRRARVKAAAVATATAISLTATAADNNEDTTFFTTVVDMGLGITQQRLLRDELAWQVYVLLRRRMILVWRSPWLLQVAVILCAAIIVGCIQGTSWSMGAFPGNAAMAMACLGVLSTVTHMRTFAADRNNKIRELDNCTNVLAYHIAYGTVDLALLLIVPLLYCGPYYLSIWPTLSFSTLYGAAWSVCWYASGMAYLITASIKRIEWLNLVGVFITVIFGAFLNGLKPSAADAQNSVVVAILLAISYNRWALAILVPSELMLHTDTQPNRAWTILSSLGMCRLDGWSQVADRAAHGSSEAMTDLIVNLIAPSVSSNTTNILRDKCAPYITQAYLILFAWGCAFRLLALFVDYTSNDSVMMRMPYHAWHACASHLRDLRTRVVQTIVSIRKNKTISNV
jgi:ABC-type multidrug transport system ATPase subunit